MNNLLIPDDLRDTYVFAKLNPNCQLHYESYIIKLIERIARLEADRDEFKKDFLESDALRAELEDELTALRLKFAHLFGRSPDGLKKLEAENAALKAREDALVKALIDILARKDMCFSKARTILAQIDAEKGEKEGKNGEN